MKKILVPVDFSEASKSAARYAFDFFRHQPVEITLFYMVNHAHQTDIPLTDIDDKLLADKHAVHIDRAKSKLNAFLLTVQSGTANASLKVQTGVFSKWIVEELPKLNYDLLIMGANGFQRLKQLIIGSNTERAVRYAQCPVLVVPVKTQYHNIDQIVLPVESALLPDTFLLSLKHIQKYTHAQVQVLWIRTPLSLMDEQQMMAVISARLRTFNIQNFKINARKNEDIVKGILNFSDEIGADAIAMFTHSRKGIANLFNGSVAEEVLHDSETPIWTFNIDTVKGQRYLIHRDEKHITDNYNGHKTSGN